MRIKIIIIIIIIIIRYIPEINVSSLMVAFAEVYSATKLLAQFIINTRKF